MVGKVDDPGLDGLFALGGTTGGIAEETLAFHVLPARGMIAAGYDTADGWWMAEMSGVFLFAGVDIGLIGRLGKGVWSRLLSAVRATFWAWR
jgi:uncharacterized ion transporter superfamily protein YfcC